MKAQAWTFDFVASMTVFFLMLVVLFFVWEYTTVQSNDQTVFTEMESKAIYTADMIIRTPGLPQDWNETNIQVLGLATEENVLNESKILMFVQLSYDEARRVLGVQNFNFYFQVLHLNSTQAQANGTDLVAGLDPLTYTNSTIIVPIERYILFDHSVAKLRLILWR